MAFSFRNLFSDNNGDSEISGSEQGERSLTPKGYFADNSRRTVYEAVTGGDHAKREDTLRARPSLDPDDTKAIRPPFLAGSATSIPVNRLASFLPASFLRRETAGITGSIELGSIAQFTRHPNPAFRISLLRLFGMLPELFSREVLPADDRELVIPAEAFQDKQATRTSPALAEAVTTAPSTSTSSVATPANGNAVTTPGKAPRLQPAAGDLPQRRQPGVAPFCGGEPGSPDPHASLPVSNSASGSASESGSDPESQPRSILANPFEKPAVAPSGPTSPTATSNPFAPRESASPAAPTNPPITGNIPPVSVGASFPGAEKTDPSVLTFNLQRVLGGASRSDLGFDPSRIPPHVTVDISLASIEQQLASAGRVDLAIGEIIEGCEQRHRPAFARARTDLVINLPLDEIRRQIPAGGGDESSPVTAILRGESPPSRSHAGNGSSGEDRLPRAIKTSTEPAAKATEKGESAHAREPAPVSPPPPVEGRIQFGTPHVPRDADDSAYLEEETPENPPEETGDKLAKPAGQVPSTEATVPGAPSLSSLPAKSPVFGSRRHAPDRPEEPKEDATTPQDAAKAGRADASGTATSDKPDHAAAEGSETAVASALRQIMLGIKNGSKEPEENENPYETPAAMAETPKQAGTPVAAASEPPVEAPVARNEDTAAESSRTTVLEFRAEEIPEQLELRAIFDVSRPIGLQEVIDRCAMLAGIEGCLVVSPVGEKRASTSNHATGVRADFYQKASRVYESVIKLAGEIGIEDVSVLNVKTASGIHTYFRHDNLCLAVMHNHAHLEEGVREKLIVVARELPHLVEKL